MQPLPMRRLCGLIATGEVDASSAKQVAFADLGDVSLVVRAAPGYGQKGSRSQERNAYTDEMSSLAGVYGLLPARHL